jgi:hypothetical protein
MTSQTQPVSLRQGILDFFLMLLLQAIALAWVAALVFGLLKWA